jgi:hypothetical protein
MNKGFKVMPSKSRQDPHPRRILVGLETEKVLVGKDFQKVDGGRFVKEYVHEQTQSNSGHIPVQITFPTRLDFQQMRDVARGHGNKETRRMEWNDVIEFQFHVQTKGQQQGKVVDAQPQEPCVQSKSPSSCQK